MQYRDTFHACQSRIRMHRLQSTTQCMSPPAPLNPCMHLTPNTPQHSLIDSTEMRRMKLRLTQSLNPINRREWSNHTPHARHHCTAAHHINTSHSTSTTVDGWRHMKMCDGVAVGLWRWGRTCVYLAFAYRVKLRTMRGSVQQKIGDTMTDIQLSNDRQNRQPRSS